MPAFAAGQGKIGNLIMHISGRLQKPMCFFQLRTQQIFVRLHTLFIKRRAFFHLQAVYGNMFRFQIRQLLKPLQKYLFRLAGQARYQIHADIVKVRLPRGPVSG